jgi:hypothetical protein
MDWGVAVQPQVSPQLVVIGEVGGDKAAEVSLAEHDDMVEALASDRTDQAFRVSILTRRSRCRRPITDTHAFEAPVDDVTIDSVPVSDQVAWSVSPGKCRIMTAAVRSCDAGKSRESERQRRNRHATPLRLWDRSGVPDGMRIGKS